MKKIIHLLLIFTMVSLMMQPILTILERKEVFFMGNYWSNFSNYKFSYENSQYVKKNNPDIITDETFESYAGGAFLNGLNPILITHDHPPLGRYLVSLSILLFNNQHTIVLFFFALAALGVYLIIRRIVQHRVLALIPLVLFLNEPLALGKLQFTPLPELFQFVFIVYAIYFFMKGISSKNSLVFFSLMSLMLGGVIATRVFALGGVLVFSFFVHLMIFNRKKILVFLMTLPLSIAVLILSYTRTIVLGASVFDIFGIQKYILYYHKSKFIFPFSFWDLLLFNRWHTWWDGNKIIQDVNWVILWPVSFGLTVLQPILKYKNRIKISNDEWVLLLWLGFYMSFLSVGYTSTRYFLPIIPFLYILALSCIIKIFSKKAK